MTTRRRTMIVALCVALSALLPAGGVAAWAPRATASPNPRPVDPRVNPRRPIPAAPTVPGASGCPIFPATNVWNRRIDDRAVAVNSSTMIAAIGLDRGVHMDFGSYAGMGSRIRS